MTPLRMMTLSGDAEREPRLAVALSAREDVDLVLRCVDRVELLAGIRSGELDAIVSVGLPPWLDRQAAAEASQAGIRLVGVTSDATARRRLQQLSARVLSLEQSVDDIVQCCNASVQEPTGRPLSGQPLAPRGKLISVWGPKGAPGRTTVAIALAFELAREGPDTLLVDADAYGGDILQLLAIAEELPTIVWAARLAARDELDGSKLIRGLRRAGSRGPVLLPGIARSELWPEISEFGWRELLVVARASFSFTVCDVGFCLESDASSYPGSTGGRNHTARTALSHADRVVALCRADPVGVKSFTWAFEGLKALVDPERVVVVANRVRSSEQQQVGEVLRRHTGKRPVAYLPDRPDDLYRATRAGVPLGELGRRSDLQSSLGGLAAALGVRVPPNGLLTRLAGRTV